MDSIRKKIVNTSENIQEVLLLLLTENDNLRQKLANETAIR